ncbi:MAG: ribosome recycling factor [Oscillospiraceae bacterium]|nr:ribosome recycling factor [Oscillospiraceae bacterium]
MAIEIGKDFYRPYEERMDKSLEFLQEEMNAVRVGRANPHVLDRITVSYYGALTPLNQVANVQVPEPRMLTIQPWDPSLLKEIEKAIQTSDLGINPTSDGKLIRLVFPTLTEERRKDLAKQVTKLGEEAKVAVRNLRREAIDQLKAYLKKKEISEDIYKDAETQVQKLTDRFTEKVDVQVSAKHKELMTV